MAASRATKSATTESEQIERSAQVVGDLRLVADDVIADQGEHRRGQDNDRNAAADPARPRSGRRSRRVLGPEQEKLILADLLPCGTRRSLCRQVSNFSVTESRAWSRSRVV